MGCGGSHYEKLGVARYAWIDSFQYYVCDICYVKLETSRVFIGFLRGSHIPELFHRLLKRYIKSSSLLIDLFNVCLTMIFNYFLSLPTIALCSHFLLKFIFISLMTVFGNACVKYKDT